MSNTLMDTMKNAKHDATSATEHALGSAKHALGTAKDAMESAKESTEHTFARTVSTLVKGASAVSGLVTMLRTLDRDDGLAWFGLARRRPLRSVAIFGAGLAMGAGAAILFAPTSGAELRRALLGQIAKPEAQGATSTAGAVAPSAPSGSRAASHNGETSKPATPQGGVDRDHRAS